MTWFCCIFKGSTTSKQQDGDSDEDFSAIGNVKIYSYNELRKATRDFTNKVGEGGFGSVYKGILKDGTSIAVKVLSQGSSQGKQEFYSELTVVSEIIHENLVRLYGCCMEDNRRILVYNYLENNSLAQTLLGSNRSNIQFNWRTRSKICIGIARGLAFLHEEVRPHIVHRDIKASNILLDKDLTPKISDFGLARLLPPNATHISTRVAGTIGYLAPEYAVRGQATRKSDIYSFGVLLLEIVSGRCNNNAKLTNEEQSFLGTSPNITHGLLVLRTWALHERGDLSQLVDIAIASDRDMDEACKFLKIGLLCTQEASKLRPTMSNVLKMLKGEMDVESENITKPGLISNFQELKIRAQNNANEINGTPSTLSLGVSPLSSGDNSQATMSFTAISYRE